MTARQRRDRIDRAMRSVDEVFVIPEVGGARMAGRVAVFHLVHLRDLFDGVLLLLARAQGHGAFVLGRSMFETSVMLGWMEDPATRDARALRWYYDFGARARRIAVELARAPDANPEELEEDLRANDRKIEKTRLELGLERPARSLNVETEAERQGRREDIGNFLAAHGFTHGDYGSLKLRVEHHADEERSTFYRSQAHRPDTLEAAANFAGRSALLGYRSALRIFELPEPASLPGLLDMIEFGDGDVEAVE